MSLEDFERRNYEDKLRAKDAEITDLLRRLADSEKTRSTYFDAIDHTVKVPKWMSKKPPTSSRHSIMLGFMLSDLHFQEVVRPEAVNGVNEYNHEISVQRFERCIERAAEHPHKYIGDRGIDGAVVCLGGDIVTGTIHDELARTNDMSTMQAITYWSPKLASGITHLADSWDCPIALVEIDGNHDRQYRKKHFKLKAEEAYTWVIYSWVNSILGDDDRITPLLSPAGEVVTPMYDLKVLWEHGDAGVGGSSGSGIGGIWPTLRRKVQNAHASHRQIGLDFDYYVVGHWHQFAASREFLVNNTMKGYDEFAMKFRFPPSRPSQAMFYVTPERGLGDWHEIWCD